MNRTFRISFALKNTYRVNSIIYSLKQIPFFGKLLPDRAYGVKGLKYFANILSIVWEILSIFLGKFLYIALMVFGLGSLYGAMPPDRVCTHIFFFLTVIGAFANTYMFNPSRDRYYALILMRMDARAYALSHYIYAMIKVLVGFLPFTLIYGKMAGAPLWFCLLSPFFVAGLKMTVVMIDLMDYERSGRAANENRLGKAGWILLFVLLAAAYGLPALEFVLPVPVMAALMIGSVCSGLASIWKIATFAFYGEMYKDILAQSMYQMEVAMDAAKTSNQKMISTDTRIQSRKKGFEYLNELFIKRHRKILWRSSLRLTAVCAVIILGMLLAFRLQPALRIRINQVIMVFLPYFVFIMYAINRGTGFTRALFMNCDHSLLTYSFFKEPKMVLKLFRIRLREIIKINLLPAAVLGGGLALLLYASGGTDRPIEYGILFVSIVCMSVFFSVHYLTIYYLLQPYNAATDMKSGTYQIVLSATYLVCFFMMRLRMPILIFGCICIAFSVLYCVVACLLVYRLAPKTFRLRN